MTSTPPRRNRSRCAYSRYATRCRPTAVVPVPPPDVQALGLVVEAAEEQRRRRVVAQRLGAGGEVAGEDLRGDPVAGGRGVQGQHVLPHPVKGLAGAS